MIDALMDKDFLVKLFENCERTTYARIVALDINERPIEEITGRVTQGSVNIDGKSTSRRSCSLNLVANEMNINDYYWGLSTKISLFVGLENKIDSRYPNIIWFNQGIFVISAFNTSQSINTYQISIQAKDKMAMLNGELGGVIESLTAEFDSYIDYSANLRDRKKKTPLKDIIREGVHKYGGEPYSNIIINDLDEIGLELMEYRGDKPIYFLINKRTGEVDNMRLDGEASYPVWKNGAPAAAIKLKDIPHYDPRMGVALGGNPDEATEIYAVGIRTVYTVAKIEYGDTCGYRLTDLTYPGTLTGRVGESFSSAVLDKIVAMLGDFEYFYNEEGKFIFQRKKTYTRNKWNGIVNDGVYDTFIKKKLNDDTYAPGLYYEEKNGQMVICEDYQWNKNKTYYEKVDGAYSFPMVETSAITYFFGNNNLITAISNTPQLGNLKNDFIIWGNKITLSGGNVPIHMRYAVDVKPHTYWTIGNEVYTTKGPNEASFPHSERTYYSQDWREIIYQMANDYVYYHEDNDFLLKIAYYNGDLYENGITGYEQYYTDILGFWRTLYNPKKRDDDYTHSFTKWEREDMASPRYVWDEVKQKYNKVSFKDCTMIKPLDYYSNVKRIYKKNGEGEYYRVFKSTDKDWYAKEKNISTKNMVKDKTYYQEKDGKMLVWNYPDKFEIGYKYYSYEGYKRANVLEKGKTYYIKVPSSNIGEPFVYEEFLTIDKETKYYSKENGQYISVNTFPRGFTYYRKDGKNFKVAFEYTHSSSLLYEKLGYILDLDLSNCSINDKLVTDEDPAAAENDCYLLIDKTYLHYKFTPSEKIKNGVYYNDKFKPFEVISKFVFGEKYYSRDKDEEDEDIAYDLLYIYDELLDRDTEYFETNEFHPKTGWNLNINDDPSKLVFWFDFLDTDGDIMKYSVKTVGDRTKAVNDTKVKSIYYRETPCVVFLNLEDWKKVRDVKPGYTYVKLTPDMENLFHISSRGKSAHNQLESFLNDFTYCTESISLTTIPVYNLQPNTRISVQDEQSHINGEYLIDKLTIPLTYNGTMNISAVKAVDTIY